MKIFVIHGDDAIKSYSRLIQFVDSAKKRNWEVTYIEESKNSPREILGTPSLFGEERFFIVKDIKILGDKDFDWINKTKISGNIVIYSDKKIAATILKKLENIEKTEEFSLPFLVFKFLEYLYPSNATFVLKAFADLTQTQAPEFIFSLVSKQFRDMYWSNLFDKPKIPPWRIQKLNSQSSKFKKGKLKNILKRLSIIDYQAKTGQSDIKESLELLFAEELI